MYLDHYGLREPPFSITPDPRFVYLSERHRDALAHLLYGIGQGGSGGFVQLTGEVGTGKTTLSRLLLEQLPDNTRVALILNPLLSPVELLETICEELRIEIAGKRGNLKALVDALNFFLLDAYASGLRVVLIIDEAQNLSAAALEQVRLLTNLETPTQKLLQIILLGQPELRDQLARPQLRQLAQRITARYHLAPLDAAESEAYLRHRWAVAGGGQFPFTKSALRHLHQHADGIPRLLNVIADRALLAGYARGERPIGERLLDQAAAEAMPQRSRWHWPPSPWIVVVLVVCVALAFWLLRPRHVVPSMAIANSTTAKTTPTTRSPATQKHAVQTNDSPIASSFVEADVFSLRIAASDGNAEIPWARLLSVWDVHANETDVMAAPACPPMLAPGLFCASGSARLNRLAQFDRPAVLKLRDKGRTAYALLLGLGPAQALLQIGDDTLRVRRTTLENSMTGIYATIWRGPRELSLPLRRGDRGPGVDWLRDRLLPAPTATRPLTFDNTLAAAVRSVQRDFGLRSDATVGPETLLALMASDVGPRLQRLPE